MGVFKNRKSNFFAAKIRPGSYRFATATVVDPSLCCNRSVQANPPCIHIVDHIRQSSLRFRLRLPAQRPAGTSAVSNDLKILCERSAEGLITAAPSAAAAPPAARVAAVVIPHVHRYATHYERYNGPIGQGVNKTTHTAVARFGNDGHHLAVVKAFTYADKGWLNEAIAWTLGRVVKLAQPPRAMLLIATLDELAQSNDPEIVRAHAEFAPMNAPVVLWCASRLDTKPPQHLSAFHWEDVVLRGSAGQRLAAFDGWIGNADRHADNAPYWVSRGVVAAIDHERLAFAQDWRVAPPQHLDCTGHHPTKLLHRFHAAIKSKKFTAKQTRDMTSAMRLMSDDHAAQLVACWGDIESGLLTSVDAAAQVNLRHFFDERASDFFICDRLGIVV